MLFLVFACWYDRCAHMCALYTEGYILRSTVCTHMYALYTEGYILCSTVRTHSHAFFYLCEGFFFSVGSNADQKWSHTQIILDNTGAQVSYFL